MKAQAVVATGILIVFILAVGILSFMGENSPSSYQIKKETSALTGFAPGDDQNDDFKKPCEEWNPGIFFSALGACENSVDKATGEKCGEGKCSRLDFKVYITGEGGATKLRASKSCYSCKKQYCKSGGYFESTGKGQKECEAANPKDKGYICEKFKPQIPATPGSPAVASASFECIRAVKACPPEPDVNMEGYFTIEETSKCKETCGPRCQPVKAKVGCLGCTPKKTCTDFNDESQRFFGDKTSCDAFCKTRYSKEKDPITGEFTGAPEGSCKPEPKEISKRTVKGDKTIQTETKSLTCYPCIIPFSQKGT